MANDRKAALEAAMKKIEKNYGKGSIMKLGEKIDQQISTVPSGSLALDVALGVGGPLLTQFIAVINFNHFLCRNSK